MTKAKKADKPVETAKPVFPAEGFVNPWGFIHLSNGVATAFGANKGTKTAITIDLQDGALIVKKA
jgi:hypothetical protein